MTTRRSFLRFGLAGGAALLPICRPAVLGAQVGPAFCELPRAQAVTALEVERFSRELPIPRILAPVRTEVEADSYELVMREGSAEILPGVQTPIWGYDGEYPGPTIRARPGRAIVVRQRNELPAPTSVHLHGARVRPDSDGHPNDLIQPGRSKDYRYPNEQLAATLWYHDHTAHRTAEQIYRGLAAFYLLADDDADTALGLPTGDQDIPLLIQDRSFNADGTLAYDSRDHNGFLGDVYVVNGVAWPFLEVAATAYRFRIANGSNSRQYELALGSGQPLTQVATDGGLLTAPTASPSIPLGPAERVEVVIDFSSMAVGGSLELRDGRSPTATPIIRFDVTRSGPSPAPLASRLRTVEPLPQATLTRDVTLDFDEATGRWLFDGLGFDPERVDAYPRLGAVERWRLHNTSHMSHPIHLHLVMFQVLDRNGTEPPALERGWKDTVRVRPGETVTIAARFDGYPGRFVYHCHNLEHEDHDMMAQFQVVDLARLAGAGRVETAAAISAATFAPGVPVAFVATAAGFTDALAGGPAAAALGGPMLLTAGEELPGATKDELRRLAPDRIFVLGGRAAVPAAVEAELTGYTAGQVERLAGESRYATAAAISRRLFAPGVAVAYVATGRDFPDALAGGAAAASQGAPVLLVEPDAVPAATAEELTRLRPGKLVVLGGRGAVSDAVATELGGHTEGPVERLAGPSRYDTAAAIVRSAFPGHAETVFVATGTDFPDALAGVPAAHGAPLLLVTATEVPEATAAEITRLRPDRIRILGGRSAVGGSVENALVRLLA